jgi:hypothetical protein
MRHFSPAPAPPVDPRLLAHYSTLLAEVRIQQEKDRERAAALEAAWDTRR